MSFDVFAPLRASATSATSDTSASPQRTRGHHLHPVIREDMVSKAQLLREGGLTNAAIARALGVTPPTVNAWIGPSPRTSAPRTRKPQSTRRSLRSRGHHGVGPDVPLHRHALDAYTVVDAPPGHSAETLPQSPSDICAAIADALGTAASARFTASGIELTYTDSDAYPWRDEDEAPLPVVPSDRYYRTLATRMQRLREQRAAYLAEHPNRDPRIDGFLGILHDEASAAYTDSRFWTANR